MPVPRREISPPSEDALVRRAADDRRVAVRDGGWSITVEWTFGTLLWASLVLFFWIAVVWMFISVFADILRRNMSGWAKAGWIILIVLLPFLGILLYVIARPAEVARDGRVLARHQAVDNGARSTNPADEIVKAAQLHEEGKITDDEYVYLKQQALSH
jgi:predicted membrane channel-forming protein YqfA (hemolysin III family)